MAIKLIAIDMDGTLLDPHHTITPAVKQAIKKAQQKGIYVVLATGRSYIGVQKHLCELEMNNGHNYCVTSNGALVQKAATGECISQETLSFEDYLYFEGLARELGVHFHAVDFNSLYTANTDISKYTVHEVSLTGIPLKYCSVNDMDTRSRFPKVMMVDEPELLDRAIARIPAEVSERFTLMKSADHFLEILHKGANKGLGVQVLAEYLGIAQEDVMALGDQANDAAMIEYAGIGIAMGNAIPELKKIAQHITLSNAEDGVAYAIEKYALN
ncbi:MULTISPECIES: sugar-phosphatase [Candidatus Fukatsuia]|uniref:sugar-phosphatase n=1 Tax=Candidatus Fukatsuia TaxID=1927833 RepID=UPI000935063A|nr:sugar-phosphatase [Candidatus Fukatsuia symbiotica]